tara:strand:+ start:2852 stop:3073 length:222 start_codon:yes stop_codon:yes gene_type:complete
MIRLLIQLYILILIINSFLSYVPSLRSQDWAAQINKVSELTCRYVRPYMPKDLPFDISPVVVIILLNLIMALW